MSTANDLLAKIEEAHAARIASRPDIVRSGPFLIVINPATNLRWFNHATVPPNASAVQPNDIRAMTNVFRAHYRMPRLEVFKETQSALITALKTEGFEIESEMPVMLCTPETFIPQTSGHFKIERMTGQSDAKAFLQTQARGFEHAAEITDDMARRMQAEWSQGTTWATLATLDDTPAAVASLAVAGQTAELAGVATVPEFRRRGAASAASTQLLEQFFSSGGQVAWLAAADETAQSVYERLGFQLLGTQVNISQPPVPEGA